ncbi:MAG: SPASM domain-containing protein [Phycisphaerae bacterium]|nr:SPASM domain-containing protein [Phycisphaerae bacterium]
MKIVAGVFADFQHAYLGGSSALNTMLGSRTIIEHTLQRLMRVEGLAGRALIVKPDDTEAARAALRRAQLSDAIVVQPIDDVPRVRQPLLRAGRLWNLHAWRGSLLGTSWFDEFVDARLVAKVLDHNKCEGVLCLAGYQPALDPALATRMIEHQTANELEATFTFTEAPPGLAGIILRRDRVAGLLEQNIPVGILFVYRPEMIQGEPNVRPPCCTISTAIVQTPARLTGDTRRSREVLAAAFAELGEDAGAGELCAYVRRIGCDWAGSLPLEVEIELTTDDPLPETTLRPRGDRVPRRVLEDVGRVGALAGELAQYDDRLIVLGGHGDPLLHPRFREVCQAVRDAGVCGLAVVTSLVELSDANFDTLFEVPVDVVQIQFDANSAEVYQQLHRRDAFDQVMANVERLWRARRELDRPRPLVVCSLTRCSANLAELWQFYDRWIPPNGWAVIEGYNEYCGLLPPDELMSTTPPTREACRRLGRRLMLLADGTVPQCAQDVAGAAALADWRSEGLGKIWAGDRLAALRSDQEGLRLEERPLCGRCREWFRP